MTSRLESHASRSAAATELRDQLIVIGAEQETEGQVHLARALARISHLLEVSECLEPERADVAAEIQTYCIDSLAQLSDVMEDETARDLTCTMILGPTSWSEYLDLIDPQPSTDAPEYSAPDAAVVQDEGPAIDPRALLRMFGARPVEEESRPQRDEDLPLGFEGPTVAQAVSVQTSPAHIELPSLPSGMDLEPELVEAFLADLADLMERIEPAVITLGNRPDDREAIRELGRCFHTLKGAAGGVGLTDIAAHIHGLEDYLGSDATRISSEVLEAIHHTLGLFDRLPEHLHRSKSEDALRAIDPIQVEADPAPLPAANALASNSSAVREGGNVSELITPASPTEPAASAEGLIRISTSRLESVTDMVAELITRGRAWSTQAKAMLSFAEEVRECRNRILESVEEMHEGLRGSACLQRESSSVAGINGSLRKVAERVDDLAVLAGAARTATVSMAEQGDIISRLTLRLWEELQAVRTSPIRGLFQRLIRVAQDAALVEGRKVEVAMEGETLEMDRATQDRAFEPMLHLIRNAVAHGIEPPEIRKRTGKSTVGRIAIRAHRAGNALDVSVEDDGSGLDQKAILAKARDLGLIGRDEVPDPGRLHNLIFHPGFSTRGKANAICGRGVGMDVVAREVATLKGSITLRTEPGRGTCVTIRLPARFAIETSLIFHVGRQVFGLPISQIEAVSSLEDRTDIEPIGRQPSHEAFPRAALTFRGREIPIIDARKILAPGKTPAPRWPKLLIVGSEARFVGLAVDSIDGTEELVVQPLGTLLAGHPLIFGTSLTRQGELIALVDATVLAGCEGHVGDPDSGPPENDSRFCDGGGQARVLVVDDSISVRSVIARYLKPRGREVEEATDGLEALSRLRGRPFQLVITDLEMPRLDGFELLAAMRKDPDLAGIPVIVTSTKVDRLTRDRVDCLGARAFLPKPVEPDLLEKVVNGLIKEDSLPQIVEGFPPE